MPYLTPESIPEEDDCRPLSIPASTDWLAIVSGALTELTKRYNWQQAGAVTVDEAVTRMQEMIEQYYTDPCVGCVTPEDTPFFRINQEGIVEQYDGTDWVAPFGEYTYPVIAARAEPTSAENICLAAKNAVNAVLQTYEEVTDQYNTTIDPQLGALAWGISAGTAFAFAIEATILASILIFLAVPFALFYFALESFGSDVWDSDFTNKLICLFINNATDTAGVVTFDMEGIIDDLGNHTDIFDPTVTEIKLFGQVDFMMRTIGEQGLNQAGSTTTITDSNCDFCVTDHCFEVDLRDNDGSAFGVVIQGGDWSSGNGILGHNYSSSSLANTFGYWEFPESIFVNRLEIDYTKSGGGGGNNVNVLSALITPVSSYNVTELDNSVVNDYGSDLLKQLEVQDFIEGLGWVINSGDQVQTVIVHKLTVVYSGTIPDGWSDNCT